LEWGLVGKCALVLQVSGLLLETIADYQKSAFKSKEGNRNRWCHVGIWKFSTHPNYLGEMLNWFGAFIGGMASFKTPMHWIMASTGMVFISIVMMGAIRSLGSKHYRKYGSSIDFLEFRRTHTFFGPNPFPKANVAAIDL
jgi:steroid 5-alpha reductase family enzyme